jgi:hypothetical protein
MFLLSLPKCLERFPDFVDFFSFSLRILEVFFKFDLSITTVMAIYFYQKYKIFLWFRSENHKNSMDRLQEVWIVKFEINEYS